MSVREIPVKSVYGGGGKAMMKYLYVVVFIMAEIKPRCFI
jgi:hypothetical protein